MRSVLNRFQSNSVVSWRLRDEDYDSRVSGAILDLVASVGYLARQSPDRQEVRSQLANALRDLSRLASTYRVDLTDLVTAAMASDEKTGGQEQ